MEPRETTSNGFEATQWSLVLRAGGDDTRTSLAALEVLYSRYWPALYAYLRHRGVSKQESEDVVQGLFSALCADRNFFIKASPEIGKFRSFLLTALKRHMTDVRAKQNAIKRGGAARKVHLDASEIESALADPRTTDPGETFDRHWAIATLKTALERLKEETESRMPPNEYHVLFEYISGKSADSELNEHALRLQISPEAFKMRASRLRKALNLTLRRVVSETINDPNDLDAELEYLRNLLRNFF